MAAHYGCMAFNKKCWKHSRINVCIRTRIQGMVVAYLTSSLQWLGVAHVGVTVKGLGASHFITSDAANGINRRATIKVRN
jgi:hypothetical protein